MKQVLYLQALSLDNDIPFDLKIRLDKLIEIAN
jgi:hypothetical protein